MARSTNLSCFLKACVLGAAGRGNDDEASSNVASSNVGSAGRTDRGAAKRTLLLNLLRGVRVTDVNTEATRAAETWAALEDIMRTHPNLSQFTNFYVGPEDVAKLTPEEILLMRNYTELQDDGKKYANKTRKTPGSY
jgi:hypothetical protein